MPRPLNDATGMTPEWRMTTVRVPRWLADRIRDRAREQGFGESWETLLDIPDVVPPAPLPARFRHHRRLPTGVPFEEADLTRISAELSRRGVAHRVVEGELRLPFDESPHTPQEYDEAVARLVLFHAAVRAAARHMGAQAAAEPQAS